MDEVPRSSEAPYVITPSSSAQAACPSTLVPCPDRLTIWPVDHGRDGPDATFQGASGFERAERHQADLQGRGVAHRVHAS